MRLGESKEPFRVVTATTLALTPAQMQTIHTNPCWGQSEWATRPLWLRPMWPSRSAGCSRSTASASSPVSRRAEAQVSLRAAEVIDLLGLNAFARKLVRELSTGTRRILDLGCLLVQRPAVVLFDEPSSGIAQREAEALRPLLLAVRRHT